MTAIQDTAFASLEAEGRLCNAVLKDLTHVSQRFGFRGDVALKFAQQFADEKRPPEICAEQVLAAGKVGEPTLEFFAGFLLSFEYLKLVAEVLGEALTPAGKYFLYCDNIDLSRRYQVEYGGATFYILPIDEATVYNEILELLYIDRTSLKKADTAAKLDAIADKARGFSQKFAPLSYEEGLKLMGPVRNVYENRPV